MATEWIWDDPPMYDFRTPMERRMIPAKTLDELERNVKAHRILQITVWRVRKARRAALRQPMPRHTCPGCFSTIYDGAAEQGWCCDCFPKREHYEQDARLPAFAPRER